MVNRGGTPKLNPKFGGVFLSALVLLVWISGCTYETPVDGSIPEDEYLLNIYFREIYDKLGGEAILGRPISPLITRGQVLFQYVEGGLLRWDSTDALPAYDGIRSRTDSRSGHGLHPPQIGRADGIPDRPRGRDPRPAGIQPRVPA